MQNNITLKQLGGFLKKICVVLCVALTTGSLSAQTISTAGGTGYQGNFSINNPGALIITFVVENTSAAPIAITNISTQMAPYFGVAPGTPSNVRLFSSATSLSGVFDITTPAWTQIGSGTAAVPPALAVVPVISGLNFIIAPGLQYRFALELSKGLAFSVNTPVPSPNSFSASGVILKLGTFQIAGAAVGFAGVSPTAPAGNTGAFFGGTITFNPTTPCTATPTPGATVTSAASVCPGVNFTLSVANPPSGSGITYQWQSGPSATGPFTNIVGATNSTYTSTLTTTTFFQAIVTCAGNPSATSTPVSVSATPSSSCYCIPPTSDCTDGDIITNVSLGTLNNPSGCGTNGYTNYTTNPAITIPDLIRGAANSASVTAGNGLFTEHVAVWVDYNRNGVFETTEYQAFGSTTGGTLTANLNVPATALLGNTRMRVRVRFATQNPATAACLGYTFGETEDYTVNIIPCVQGVITSQPTNKTVGCSGSTAFSVTATGSLISYQWEYRTSATGPWLLVPNTPPFSGANTATLSLNNVPSTFNNYQFRVLITGPCTAIDFSTVATLTVGPLVGIVSPTSANLCLGAIQQFSLPPSSSEFCSGTVNLQIPDVLGPPASTAAQANAGISSNIPVSIPAGSTVTSARVRFNITHPYNGDLVIVLKAPNGRILNLDYHKTGTGTAGLNFTNTVISSLATAAISSGTSPYTGTFRADASIGAGTLADPSGSGPTGFAPDVTTWAPLFTTPNGTWTLAIADPSPWAGDIGTLNDWCIELTYGVPSTGIFTGPAGTIFTDAAGTIPYTGTPASTVYINPTATANYTLVVSNALCTAAPITIPIQVSTPLSGVAVVSTTSTCANGNATFTVSATAGNLQNVQWQVSTNGGTSFTNIANGGIYSGATTATLTVTGAPITANNYQYRAVITNACNSATSNVSTLTVNPTPEIVVSSNPTGAITPGMTTTLSVAVAQNNATNYQWYLNGEIIPGATNSTLVVGIDALGDYTVAVVDVNGCRVTSAPISITGAESNVLFIYPSPTTGQFQVRYQNAVNQTTSARLNVYDSKGARVFSKNYSISSVFERMDVDLRFNGKGVYMVELLDSKGIRIKAGRVVVF